MAKDHPGAMAFGRFADFDNYYDLRKGQEKYLHRWLEKLGGQPEEEQPLFFVVEGNDYLWDWFINTEARLW